MGTSSFVPKALGMGNSSCFPEISSLKKTSNLFLPSASTHAPILQGMENNMADYKTNDKYQYD